MQTEPDKLASNKNLQTIGILFSLLKRKVKRGVGSNFIQKRFVYYLFILFLFSSGIANEHSFKIDLGRTSGFSTYANFMGSLQYQFGFKNNVALGLKHIQRHGNYEVITSTGPVFGYTLHLGEHIFSEIEGGLGLHIDGGPQLIPDLTVFISFSPAFYFPVSKWISVGIRYGMVNKPFYEEFIHDFSITSKISIVRK